MNTIIYYTLYILLIFLEFILLRVMLGLYFFIESHQSSKIDELRIFNMYIGLCIILITSISYNAYANYFLKDNLFFIKELTDLLNKSYSYYVKKICKNVFVDILIYNCIFKESINWINAHYVKEITCLTFILSKLYLCKYDDKKHKFVYLIYLSILSIFIFNDNLFASALNYIFANIITYILKKNVALNIIIKNNYKIFSLYK